jgi:hypothetical protein
MIKQALEYLVSLKDNKTYIIEGHTYSDRQLHRIDAPKRRPDLIAVNGLDSICKLIRRERNQIGRTMFVQIKSHDHVRVFSTYDHEYDRCSCYECRADVPYITTDKYMGQDQAIIQLSTLYIPNEGVNYLKTLLGSISNESKVTSSDNGITQKIEAKSGIALTSLVEIKQRVTLRPFRTFLEVDQPESEFIVRVNDGGNVALFEADGGVWRLEAKKNIADYFNTNLSDLIENGDVIVIR